MFRIGLKACWIGLFLLLNMTEADAQSVLKHELTAIEGGPLRLSEFEGSPLLIVNTASFCGYTPQYKALQELYDRYRQAGLIVLGVPSNDFGRQEPGSNDEIKAFCAVNFAVDFPMSEKVVVSGEQSHPLFKDLRSALGDEAGPHWNFYKFLIDGNGRAVASWPSGVEPLSASVTDKIELLLDLKS